MAPETRESFDTKARAEGWTCTRCGKPITFEDREAYREARRCARCHDETDTESGAIEKL